MSVALKEDSRVPRLFLDGFLEDLTASEKLIL